MADNSYSPHSPCFANRRPFAMDEIAKIILSARRRKLLRSHPVFERFAPASEADLYRLASGLHFKFAPGLARWLRLAGYGDIDHTLSFRKNHFAVISGTELNGCVAFAQDSADNRYAFNPGDGSIYCIHHAAGTVLRVAHDFPAFMQELIRHDYQLPAWMDSLMAAQ